MMPPTATPIHRPASAIRSAAPRPQRTCPLCGAADPQPYAHIGRANFSSQITSFDIVRCRACELAFIDPPPTQRDLDELYIERNVFSRPFPNPNVGRLFFRQLEPLYARHGLYYHFIAARCLRYLSPARTHPAILDIGCSTGRLLAAFKALRPTARFTGIDIDPDARRKAPPDIRPHVMIGDVRNLDPQCSYDIITMCFIIEHLPGFHSVIAHAVRLLAPNGVLCIATPDLDSAKARQMNTRWRLLNDPHQALGHVCWFNPPSLRLLARQHHLQILALRHRGELLYHLPRGVQRALHRLLGSSQAPSGERFIRNYQLRILWAVLCDGFLSQRLGYGDSLFLFARKPAC